MDQIDFMQNIILWKYEIWTLNPRELSSFKE